MTPQPTLGPRAEALLCRSLVYNGCRIFEKMIEDRKLAEENTKVCQRKIEEDRNARRANALPTAG